MPLSHCLASLVVCAHLLLACKCDGAIGLADPTLIYAVRSEFSHILVRERQGVRTLYFVRDNGYQAAETRMRMSAPHRLQMPYSQFMFTHLLFDPEPEHVLLVGLGGGAMVRFLNHHFPKLRVDAVEIDPEVVDIALEYFGVERGDPNSIITEDAFVYLARTDATYDVIYMDAFLKPAADTDATGVPLRLKTAQFYRELQARLRPGGMVMVNLNRHAGAKADIAILAEAFPQTYVFRVRRQSNIVVLCSLDSLRPGQEPIMAAAHQLDTKADWGFAFADLIRNTGTHDLFSSASDGALH